jgi:hypothetical protein
MIDITSVIPFGKRQYPLAEIKRLREEYGLGLPAAKSVAEGKLTLADALKGVSTSNGATDTSV